jgi:hypothetical protein
VYKDNGESCISEKAFLREYNDLRIEALNFAKGEYGRVIDLYARIINDKKATAIDFSTIGFAFIMTKTCGKAIKFLKEGEKQDDTELLVKLNLAHAYLMNDELRNAKSIYKAYRSQNINDSLSWIQKIKQDFWF